MKDYVEQYLEAKRLVIEQNRPTCQKRFFQHVADKFLAFAEEKLTEKELKVASGILKGKPLPEIGAEMGCSGDSIRLCWHKIEPVLLEQIDFPAYRNENKTLSDENAKLRDENAKLREEVERLRTKIIELERTRDLSPTPFSTPLSELGFSTGTQIGLSDLGCKTLGDLVQLDELTIMKTRRLGPTVTAKIKDKLQPLGLHLGMDLMHMSDEDFTAIIDKLKAYLNKFLNTND